MGSPSRRAGVSRKLRPQFPQFCDTVRFSASPGFFVHRKYLLTLRRFGPNTFPAHNSVIYSAEVQVELIAKTLLCPIIDHRATIVEINEGAEEEFANEMDRRLEQAGSVFSAGCSNWYINAAGRNSASWPGKAANLWYATWITKWKDYSFIGGDATWLPRRLYRQISTNLLSQIGVVGALLAGAVLAKPEMSARAISAVLDAAQSYASSLSLSNLPKLL
jgi:hypothetical protein